MGNTKNKKVIHAKWNGNAIILGVPTRTLNEHEYKDHKNAIEESEKASNMNIYTLFFEDNVVEKEN